ncbi:unnamed protein product, partial [Soboliphyme baturini]|uniref:SSD domain-containing protein n=1 Tax=Soboliphyme baturini TaxID=241478 RepID=A0A183J9N5_9BILA
MASIDLVPVRVGERLVRLYFVPFAEAVMLRIQFHVQLSGTLSDAQNRQGLSVLEAANSLQPSDFVDMLHGVLSSLVYSSSLELLVHIPGHSIPGVRRDIDQISAFAVVESTWLTLLLSSFLLYDIFMVFISPFVTGGCNIMLYVATGGTCNEEHFGPPDNSRER